MVDIQYPTAVIRQGKKEKRRKKPQDENIMSTSAATQGDHNQLPVARLHMDVSSESCSYGRPM